LVSPGDKAKRGPARSSIKPIIELVQRKLLRVVGNDGGFEGLAGLRFEVVDVIDSGGSEPIPVRPGNETAVESCAGGKNCLRSGAETGIALIAQPGLRETRELIGSELFIDQFEQVLNLLAKLGRDVRHLQRRLQITARLVVGAKLIIEHAELKARCGKPGIIEAKLFVSADRRFDIAAVRRRRSILNRIAEIAWLGQHARKQRIDGLGEIGSALT